MLSHFRQLCYESLVYGLAGTISSLLTVFLVPIYTRIFTPEDYGVMSLISTTMAIVLIFVVLALDNSAHRWYWENEETIDRRNTISSWAWCQIIVSFLFAIVIFFASDILGQTIVGRSDAGLYFRLTSLALPLGVLGIVTTNWLRMQRRPWATVIFALGTNLLTILLTVLLVVVFRWGLSGVYTAQLISVAVGMLIAAVLLGDWIKLRYFRLDRLLEMLRFALPLIPSALAFWVVNCSNRFFVQSYATTSEVGLYHVGNSMALLVALVTGAFQQAWGPFALSIHKQGDARLVYANVLLAYVWLTSLIGTALTLFAPEAIRLIATEQYVGASQVVGILAFSYVMIGLSYIAAIGPAIVKKTRPTGVAITFAAGLNIILNFLLTPLLGKLGAALATLLSQAVVPVYLFYRSQQMYPIPYRFASAAGIFGVAFLLIALGAGWQTNNLWVGIAAKIALLGLFVPVLFLFRIITIAQARRLLRIPITSIL